MAGRGTLIQLIVIELTAKMDWRARFRIIVFSAPVMATLATLGYAVESGIYVLRSEVASGTVVQVYEREGTTPFDRGRVNYEPVFTYLDGGEERRASVGSGHTAFDLAIGETADIRHVPGSRGNVRIDTWEGLWFIPLALAGFAIVCWIVAGLIWALLTVIFFRKGTS